jgi:hypothetical protein
MLQNFNISLNKSEFSVSINLSEYLKEDNKINKFINIIIQIIDMMSIKDSIKVKII